MTTAVVAYGQEKPKAVETYTKHVQMGNLFTRWYYNIRGTSTVFKEQLTLYGDSTYRYVYVGGECGTFDTDETGNWRLTGNLLVLNGKPRYQIVNHKLYYPESYVSEKKWVMKK